ncbi:MAG: enoyl-CoA hydratase/isomerase family protein [Chloroflexi bacterium]|nr:enoyl-CoA hydratase/isomerase family protein [Chloroflexota bacterium]
MSDGNESMTDFATIIYDKTPEGVAWITLNRPQRLNAIAIGTRDDLWEIMHAVQDDPDVRVVIFRGAGRAFSTGADLSEFLTAPSPVIAREVRWERDIWGYLMHFPKPMIAAIHGYCIGSGCELALTCDLRVCSDDARFGMPETARGIIPAAGGSQTLPRAIGRAHALHLFLTGDMIGPEDALRMGLVNRVVARNDLEATAEAWARRMLTFDDAQLRAAKAAVVRGQDVHLEEGLALERRLWQGSRSR